MILRRRRPTRLEGWDLPSGVREPGADGTVLGPHGGAAGVFVDRRGWTAPVGAPWSLDWAVRTGDGWERPSAKGVEQRLIGGASIETTLSTAVGPIIHRVAVGVVGGRPAVITELVNAANVAVATAVAVRPFGRLAEGGVAALAAGAEGVEIAGDAVLTADRPAAALVTADADGGDAFDALMTLGDDAAPARPVTLTSATGAANAVLVWPLAHGAAMRLIAPLADPLPAGAAVPAVDDIIRGWDRHLADTAAFAVEELPVADMVPALARDLTCRVPEDGDVAVWMTGLTELGLGREAIAGIEWLSTDDAPAETIFAIGRLHHLGFRGSWQEQSIEPLARAAHRLRKPSADKSLPVGWRAAVVDAAAASARDVDQPEVADGLAEIAAAAERVLANTADANGGAASAAHLSPVDHTGVVDRLADASETWTWPSADGREGHSLRASAEAVRAIRNTFVRDSADAVDLMPSLPPRWRGRALEAHRIPTVAGELSFGLRWHGPRPALLWELHPVGDEPVSLRVPSISPTWATSDLAGETLLPDPGWDRT